MRNKKIIKILLCLFAVVLFSLIGVACNKNKSVDVLNEFPEYNFSLEYGDYRLIYIKDGKKEYYESKTSFENVIFYKDGSGTYKNEYGYKSKVNEELPAHPLYQFKNISSNNVYKIEKSKQKTKFVFKNDAIKKFFPQLERDSVLTLSVNKVFAGYECEFLVENGESSNVYNVTLSTKANIPQITDLASYKDRSKEYDYATGQKLASLVNNTFKGDFCASVIAGTEEKISYQSYENNVEIKANGLKNIYADGFAYLTESNGYKYSVYTQDRVGFSFTKPNSTVAESVSVTDYGYEIILRDLPQELVAYGVNVYDGDYKLMESSIKYHVKNENLERAEICIIIYADGKLTDFNYGVRVEESVEFNIPTHKEYPFEENEDSASLAYGGFTTDSNLWTAVKNEKRNSVLMFFKEAIVEIDAQTDTVIGRYLLPSIGTPAAADFDGERVYISYFNSTVLDVCDASTMEKISSLDTGISLTRFYVQDGKIISLSSAQTYNLSTGEIKALSNDALSIKKYARDKENHLVAMLFTYAYSEVSNLIVYDTFNEKIVANIEDFKGTRLNIADGTVFTNRMSYNLQTDSVSSVISPAHNTKRRYVNEYSLPTEYYYVGGYIFSDEGVYNAVEGRWINTKIINQNQFEPFELCGKIYYHYEYNSFVTIDYAGNKNDKIIEVYAGEKPKNVDSYEIRTNISLYSNALITDNIYTRDGFNLLVYDKETYVLKEQTYGGGEHLFAICGENDSVYVCSRTSLYKYVAGTNNGESTLEKVCVLPYTFYSGNIGVHNGKVYYCAEIENGNRLLCYDYENDSINYLEGIESGESRASFLFGTDYIYISVENGRSSYIACYNYDNLELINKVTDLVYSLIYYSYIPISQVGERIYCGNYSFNMQLEDAVKLRNYGWGFCDKLYVGVNAVYDYRGYELILIEGLDFGGEVVFDEQANRIYLCDSVIYVIDLNDFGIEI